MTEAAEPDDLRSELDRLRVVTELADVAIAETDPEFRLRWANAAYGRLVWRPVDQLVGRSLAEVLGVRVADAVRRALEGGGAPVELEIDVAQEPQGLRWLHLRFAPIPAARGVPGGFVHTAHDVTLLRQTEPGARLAAIVESSDDAIVGKNLNGIVTSWNEGARRIFGYTADEMIGQPIQRIMPSDRVDDMHRILDRIRAGERVEHFETERIRKDGQRIQVSLTVSPIKDATGRVVGASKIARDVTDRRRAEAALRETLDLLATLNRTSVLLSGELELAKLVQTITDAATEITGARHGSFFYNVTDPHGESYMLYALSGAAIEQFRDKPMPRNTALFAATFRGEGIVRVDDIRRDPRYGLSPPHHGLPDWHVPVRSYLAAPVVLRGEVLGGLFFGHPEPGVFTERDERFVAGIAAQAAIAMDNARHYTTARIARDEAEAASRAKDELLSVVSHELRTPLTSMLGWVAVLRQGKLGPEATERALQTIERSGRIQQELIEDLLDVSRVVAGTLTLQLEAIDLRTVVTAALDAIRVDAAAKDVRLEAVLDEPAVVVGDAIRLQQVVSNVLANAIKFTPAGCAVRVTVLRERDRAVLIVQDEGAGIAPAFLPFVFEPFRQAEDVRKRKGGGLGLGLTIVKNLIEQHGGTVSAASEGVDRGATLTISLPLAPEDVEREARPESVEHVAERVSSE